MVAPEREVPGNAAAKSCHTPIIAACLYVISAIELTENVFYISMLLHNLFYPEIEDYDHTEGNSIPAENLEIVASDVS